MSRKAKLVSSDDESIVSPLITYYGEFWNPEVVNWNDQWKLWGRTSKVRGELVNAYEQRGVYVLFHEFEVVYVGKAIEQSIGYRIQSHRGSVRKGPRWDRFSWFGMLKKTEAIGKDKPKKAIRRKLSTSRDAMVSTLEALMILISEPKLNLRRESLRGSTKLYQADDDAQASISERLSQIEEHLSRISPKQ